MNSPSQHLQSSEAVVTTESVSTASPPHAPSSAVPSCSLSPHNPHVAPLSHNDDSEPNNKELEQEDYAAKVAEIQSALRTMEELEDQVVVEGRDASDPSDHTDQGLTKTTENTATVHNRSHDVSLSPGPETGSPVGPDSSTEVLHEGDVQDPDANMMIAGVDMERLMRIDELNRAEEGSNTDTLSTATAKHHLSHSLTSPNTETASLFESIPFPNPSIPSPLPDPDQHLPLQTVPITTTTPITTKPTTSTPSSSTSSPLTPSTSPPMSSPSPSPSYNVTSPSHTHTESMIVMSTPSNTTIQTNHLVLPTSPPYGSLGVLTLPPSNREPKDTLTSTQTGPDLSPFTPSFKYLAGADVPSSGSTTTPTYDATINDPMYLASLASPEVTAIHSDHRAACPSLSSPCSRSLSLVRVGPSQDESSLLKHDMLSNPHSLSSPSSSSSSSSPPPSPSPSPSPSPLSQASKSLMTKSSISSEVLPNTPNTTGYQGGEGIRDCMVDSSDSTSAVSATSSSHSSSPSPSSTDTLIGPALNSDRHESDRSILPMYDNDRDEEGDNNVASSSIIHTTPDTPSENMPCDVLHPSHEPSSLPFAKLIHHNSHYEQPSKSVNEMYIGDDGEDEAVLSGYESTCLTPVHNHLDHLHHTDTEDKNPLVNNEIESTRQDHLTDSVSLSPGPHDSTGVSLIPSTTTSFSDIASLSSGSTSRRGQYVDPTSTLSFDQHMIPLTSSHSLPHVDVDDHPERDPPMFTSTHSSRLILSSSTHASTTIGALPVVLPMTTSPNDQPPEGNNQPPEPAGLIPVPPPGDTHINPLPTPTLNVSSQTGELLTHSPSHSGVYTDMPRMASYVSDISQFADAGHDPTTSDHSSRSPTSQSISHILGAMSRVSDDTQGEVQEALGGHISSKAIPIEGGSVSSESITLTIPLRQPSTIENAIGSAPHILSTSISSSLPSSAPHFPSLSTGTVSSSLFLAPPSSLSSGIALNISPTSGTQLGSDVPGSSFDTDMHVSPASACPSGPTADVGHLMHTHSVRQLAVPPATTRASTSNLQYPNQPTQHIPGVTEAPRRNSMGAEGLTPTVSPGTIHHVHRSPTTITTDDPKDLDRPVVDSAPQVDGSQLGNEGHLGDENQRLEVVDAISTVISSTISRTPSPGPSITLPRSLPGDLYPNEVIDAGTRHRQVQSVRLRTSCSSFVRPPFLFVYHLLILSDSHQPLHLHVIWLHEGLTPDHYYIHFNSPKGFITGQ